MELKFSRARFDAGEMPTRTRGGLRVLKVVDSGLAVRYPIAAWIADGDADCIGPRRYSRDGRYGGPMLDGPMFDNTFDLAHEPKREPLSDERIDEIGDPFGYFQYGDAQGDKRRAFARAVERAAYERAAQECDPHEDDDRIDRQIKREIADRIRALGRQHG